MHPPDHHPHGRGAQLTRVEPGRPGFSKLALDFGHERPHILSPVAVLGDLLPTRQRPDRFAELEDLRAGVIDVELALDLVPVKSEHTRQSIAVGGVAGVPDVHWTGRIGRHELHDDPLGRARPRASEALAGGEYRGQGGAVPRVGEEQVQEAGSGHLETLELLAETLSQCLAEALGQLARRGAGRGREQQRGIGRVVAEVRSRWALERDRLPAGVPLGDHGGYRQHGLAQTDLGGYRAHWRGSYAPSAHRPPPRLRY